MCILLLIGRSKLLNKEMSELGSWLPINGFPVTLVYADSRGSLSGIILCQLVNLCEEKIHPSIMSNLASGFECLTYVLQPCSFL
jgi:hypothetical protein